MLLSGNHNYKNLFYLISKEIIDNGSWVGVKSIVCGGVKSHCVLSVGSVASSDFVIWYLQRKSSKKN